MNVPMKARAVSVVIMLERADQRPRGRTKGSVAQNVPPHIAPSGTFQVPPTNLGRVIGGWQTY